MEHSLVSAAMERSLERTDGGRYGGVHVRQRGGGHARRKRGSIQFVVGMQDECDVQSPLRCPRGSDAI